MRILRAPSLGLGRWFVLFVGLGLLAQRSAARADGKSDKAPLPAVFAKSMPENAKDLKEIEEHVKKLVKKTMHAAVGIFTHAQSIDARGIWIGKLPTVEILNQFLGSGVVVTKDGFILTAGHVFRKPDYNCLILFSDGRTFKGKTLGANHGIDSGMVKITDKGEFPFCEMGDSTDLEAGRWCIAIGHADYQKEGRKPQKGRQPVVRVGRVQSAGNSFIQTDCALVSGDDGGPLFDMHGKVVGIHSRIGNDITANFHVPVNTYRDTWDRLAKGEEWGNTYGFGKMISTDAYMGLTLDPDSKDCRVRDVTKNSPAEKAGLKANDVVRLFDGKKIATQDDLIREMQSKRPEDEVALEILRGDDTIKLRVTLSKRPG
jgi:serine protease Do